MCLIELSIPNLFDGGTGTFLVSQYLPPLRGHCSMYGLAIREELRSVLQDIGDN